MTTATFSGHPKGEQHCDGHETFDKDCYACVEADAYCPHGFLTTHHHEDPGMQCWRPRNALDDWGTVK